MQTTSKNHRHRPIETRDQCFTGPVSPQENPAAHGGVCRVDTCRCGAERRTNRNQGHIERGVWT